jgi:ethanolamine ammonia-lyase small subunit
MIDITDMTDAELDALLSPEAADSHIYWHHKTAARVAWGAARRISNAQGRFNAKRAHQSDEVKALLTAATVHMTAAAALA